MRLKIFALACIGLVLTVSKAQGAEPLKLNAEKSKIGFLGKKPDGKHAGGFKKFEVDAQVDYEDPAKGSLKIDIDAASLWSDDDKLTEHLKSPDFFNVRNHPKITFSSTKIEANETEATITGKLKMLGKEEEIKVPCAVSVEETSLALKATFKLDRTKWGMKYGEGKINNDVEITAELTFKR